MDSCLYTLHSWKRKKIEWKECRSPDENHTTDLLNQTEGNTIVSPGKSLVKEDDAEVTRLPGTIIWLRSTFILIGTRTALKSLFIIPDSAMSYRRGDVGEFPLPVVSLAFSPICTWRRLTLPTHPTSISLFLSFIYIFFLLHAFVFFVFRWCRWVNFSRLLEEKSIWRLGSMCRLFSFSLACIS